MLNGITWTQYFIAVALLGLLYYLYLFLHFARRAQKKEYGELYETIDSGDPATEMEISITDELFEKSDELIEKLTISIRGEDNKAQLRALLSASLMEYPELNIPAFRAGINNRIQTELEKSGVMTMSEVEIDGLW